jgi:hypothetical protein
METTQVVINRNTEPEYKEYAPFMPAPSADEDFLCEQSRNAEKAKRILFDVFKATVDQSSPKQFESAQWLAYKAASEAERVILKAFSTIYRERVKVAQAAYIASKDQA